MLRSLCDNVIEKGEKVFITFIGYLAAFDSVSHRYLDKALGESGVSDKSRPITRDIYSDASVRTTVKVIDGEMIYSDVFPVCRGR